MEINFGNWIVTYYPTHRVTRNGHPIYFDFHPFGGPTFYMDRDGDRQFVATERIPKSWWRSFNSWFKGQRRCPRFGHARSAWDRPKGITGRGEP